MRRSLVLAAAIALAMPGCSWLKNFAKKPEVKLQKVDIVGIDFQQARLRADLLVSNRVNVPVKIAKVTYGVRIDDSKLASGEIVEAVEVPALGSVPVQVPFALSFEDVYRISEKYKEKDDAPYRLEGTLQVETPVGPVTLPFKHDGLLPVLKVPQIDLAKAEVKGVSFTGADLRFKFNVKNANKFALDVKSLDYVLTLAGARILDGKLPSALAVPAKGAGTFEAEVKVSFQQAAAAANAISHNSNAEYSLGGNFSAGTPWGTVDSPYAKTGTIKIQK